MAEVFDFNDTDANNIDRWPEGMLGGQINNAGRADEGILARWYHDQDYSRIASGAANAFAVTSARVIPALFDNLVQAFTANFSITGPATLNLNGTGARTIKRFNGSDLAAGDIVSGQPVLVAYKSVPNVWFMLTAPAALVTNMFGDFSENVPANPAADVARVYARDVNGTTRLAYRDSAGVENILGYQGELVAIIEDRKAQNTASQFLTAGVDNVRELQTLAFNRNSLVSLSSNRFTLPAGTYEIAWVSPVNLTASGTGGSHQSFLYNQTDSAEVARGTSGDLDGAGDDLSDGQDSNGCAVVTIAGSKAFEIRHRSTAGGVRGGNPANIGTEVYTRVTVRRA